MSIISFPNSISFAPAYAPTPGHSGSGSSSALIASSVLAYRSLNRPMRISFTYVSGVPYTTLVCGSGVTYPAGKYVFAVLNHSLPENAKVGALFRNFGGSTILTVSRLPVLSAPDGWLFPSFFGVVTVPSPFYSIEFQVACLDTRVYDIGGLFLAPVFSPVAGSGILLDSFRTEFEDKSRRITAEDETSYFVPARVRRLISGAFTGLSYNEARSMYHNSAALLTATVGVREPVIALPYVPTVPSDDGQRLKMMQMGLHGHFRQPGVIKQISKDSSGQRYSWSEWKLAEGG